MRNSIMLCATVIIIAMSSVLFAQNAPINFEAGGQGANWTWTVFENGTNPPVQIMANPDASGINTSSTVAQFTALVAGQPWAGCESQHGSDIGTFTFNASNCTVKIMVHKPVISDVGIKFVSASSASSGEIKVPNTLINQWEELTFDFSSRIGETNDQIVIFPDFDLAGRVTDNVVYFDNITFSAQIEIPAPAEAAPDPIHDPAYVISLFSNAYTNVPVDTWSAPWDMADVADIQIDGNDTKLYTNLVYAGIEFTSQTIDATDMTHFHMDIWTPDPTALPAVFKIKLVDFGAGGVWGGGDDVEHELTFDANTTPALTSEAWIGFDIPLADFTGLTTTGHLAQLIISGDPNTVYVDNVYFHSGIVDISDNISVPNPSVLGNSYPNPFKPATTISYSIQKSAHVTLKIYDSRGRLVDTLVEGEMAANSYQQVWNAGNLPSGVYFYRLTVDDQAIDTKRMVLLK
ncbi:MAG: T9SS type A sorting domain-containing protein [Candidatus Syntrophosphaera sp.]|nr:T9SS type A sorting domain-containing protein [Candidatus Syntrophosphaera sp.]